MKIEEFEAAIETKGLVPMEVRLRHNHVQWFICRASGMYPLYIFDKDGRAFVLAQFDWDKSGDNIQIESYKDNHGRVIGLAVNGHPVMTHHNADLFSH